MKWTSEVPAGTGTAWIKPSRATGAAWWVRWAPPAGVVVTVIGTKFLFEQGSAESRTPKPHWHHKLLDFLTCHSLTIFLLIMLPISQEFGVPLTAVTTIQSRYR